MKSPIGSFKSFKHIKFFHLKSFLRLHSFWKWKFPFWYLLSIIQAWKLNKDFYLRFSFFLKSYVFLNETKLSDFSYSFLLRQRTNGDIFPNFFSFKLIKIRFFLFRLAKSKNQRNQQKRPQLLFWIIKLWKKWLNKPLFL